MLGQWESLASCFEDSEALVEILQEDYDHSMQEELFQNIEFMKKEMSHLEIKNLLSGKMDSHNSYLSIHSGAGGTEASDWAEILLRMFLKYSEKQGFKAKILSLTEGDEAGLKSVQVLVEGSFAYGYLKAFSGVHRLVRISPFDANKRRHTSFAAVFLWPEVDDEIEIEIKNEDLRVDTYRAGGKGGQHVNRTDSAVRMVHLPTHTTVQCQSQRSQLANRQECLKMLKAALYQRELRKRDEEKGKMDALKKANEWGSQILSYVLVPYQMVKDHRTSCESSKPHEVLDGDLQSFVDSFLRWSLKES